MMKQSFPLYNQKSCRTLLSMFGVLTLLNLLIFLACILHTSRGFLIFSIIFFSILIISSLAGMLSVGKTKIEINEEGILYKSIIKKCGMRWQDVKTVGITGNTSSKNFVFFTFKQIT